MEIPSHRVKEVGHPARKSCPAIRETAPPSARPALISHSLGLRAQAKIFSALRPFPRLDGRAGAKCMGDVDIAEPFSSDISQKAVRRITIPSVSRQFSDSDFYYQKVGGSGC